MGKGGFVNNIERRLSFGATRADGAHEPPLKSSSAIHIYTEVQTKEVL
jgi:hypothetical protein